MKMYNERWFSHLKEIDPFDLLHEQEFIKIDETHAQGVTDSLIYQILPYDELFVDDKFIGGFQPIYIYINEDKTICFNYAEDGDIEDYVTDKGMTLITGEVEYGFEWHNKSCLGDASFETIEELEYYLKSRNIDYVKSGLTLFINDLNLS